MPVKSNAEKSGTIRQALNKLFGSEVIVRSSSGGQIKTVDVRQSQAVTRSFHHDKYRRMYQSGMSSYAPQTADKYGFHANRVSLFQTYEEMDEDPIISSALDIYANEAATKDAFGEIVDVECENGEIKSVLENLIYDILHVQDNARWWARSVAKYGDLFMKLEVYQDHGVVNVQPLSPYNIQRYTDPDTGRTQFSYEEAGHSTPNQSDITFEEWEIAHFRFTNDSNFFPYGKALIENGRMIWQQLTLMEEAMLIHRIMRAPEKRVFKIDIGNIEPDAVDSYMKGIINDIQQTPLMDQQTGQYNLEFNMRNMLEDFFLPVRGRENGTEINSLQGLQYQVIEDVEYLRKKLMSALKVPNAFLGYENEIQGKCIDPKTEIPLIGGETVTAEEIIDHYNNDDGDSEPLYTYSYDEESGEMVAGEIEAAEMTRRNAEVVEVELDNDETIVTTPDHKFMTRDGDWIEAQNLEPGQPLMPLQNAIQSTHKNHEVVSVTKLEGRIDTCDIQVKKYHNFAVSAGVIIHNSTLAQESIKFANAVRNLQESLAQELKKIALVHLYTKGYKNQDLVGFNFKFTNPSIVAEQERIEFLSRKAGVARDLRELPIHSDKWIAKNIFNMSEEEYEEQLREKVRDWKRNFRKEQIEREGNDPVKTGQSYGTPGDLAASGNVNLKNIDMDDLAKKGEDGDKGDNKPKGEFDSVTKQDDDKYGLKDMSNLLRPKSSDLKQNFQGGSPLALDSVAPNHKKNLIQESLKQEIMNEQSRQDQEWEIPDDSFMNENIIDSFPDPNDAMEILE